MSLITQNVTVETKQGSLRSHGTATIDFAAPGATLVAAVVIADDDVLRTAGASATASVDGDGVVTVHVEGPLTTGTVDVAVTVND